MLITVVLWSTIGILLTVAGFPIDSWQFWCGVGTYWAVSVLSTQNGRIQGIVDFLEMSNEEQQKIKRMVRDARESVK